MFKLNTALAAAFAAARQNRMLNAKRIHIGGAKKSLFSRSNRSRNRYTPHQGEREKARRVRQMAAAVARHGAAL